jgi:hypothetical protein
MPATRPDGLSGPFNAPTGDISTRKIGLAHEQLPQNPRHVPNRAEKQHHHLIGERWRLTLAGYDVFDGFD